MNPVARVLVVDNDFRFLELASSIFTNQGVEVVCASDPDQAHFHLNGGPKFDAVVADLSSPYFGSPQYCQSLVNKFPLVVVSATEDSSFLERYSSLCDCVLAKSSIADLLFLATVKAVERHQLGLQLVG
tara:strand:+ start:2881 stop:3267 length:387 start_codon:yes stop_codon:yes gene_type:complete